MGFMEDFGSGFIKPYEWAYHKIEKVDRVADKALDGAGNLVEGLADLLNGNTLLIMGAVTIGLIVLMKM